MEDNYILGGLRLIIVASFAILAYADWFDWHDEE